MKLRRTLDWTSGSALGLLFAAPSLRVLTGVSGAIYAAPAGALLLSAVLNLHLCRPRRPAPLTLVYVAATLLMIAVLLFSSTWAPAQFPWGGHVWTLLGLAFLVVVVPPVVNQRVARVTFGGLGILGVGVSVFVLWGYFQSGALSGYSASLRESYLVLARGVAMGAVAVPVYAMTARRRHRLLWGASIVLLAGLGLSLARGALLSTILILIGAGIYVSMSDRIDDALSRHRSKGLWPRVRLSLLAGGLVAGTLFVAFSVRRTASRLLRLMSGREFQASRRGELWATGWESIQQAPVFGYGLGSHGPMSGTTVESYPHNLILQVWLDGGVLAALLLLLIMGLPFVAFLLSEARKRREVRLWLPFLAVYCLLLMEYGKSSNFYAARELIIAGVISMSFLNLKKNLVPKRLKEHVVGIRGTGD